MSAGATILRVTSRADIDEAGAPRWNGRPGRLEVHYLTATDDATGTGLWLHHEVVAPTEDGKPYAHGWIAVFPPDGPPSYERFGPTPTQPTSDSWGGTETTSMTATSATGTTS